MKKITLILLSSFWLLQGCPQSSSSSSNQAPSACDPTMVPDCGNVTDIKGNARLFLTGTPVGSVPSNARMKVAVAETVSMTVASILVDGKPLITNPLTIQLPSPTSVVLGDELIAPAGAVVEIIIKGAVASNGTLYAAGNALSAIKLKLTIPSGGSPSDKYAFNIMLTGNIDPNTKQFLPFASFGVTLVPAGATTIALSTTPVAGSTEHGTTPLIPDNNGGGGGGGGSAVQLSLSASTVTVGNSVTLTVSGLSGTSLTPYSSNIAVTASPSTCVISRLTGNCTFTLRGAGIGSATISFPGITNSTVSVASTASVFSGNVVGNAYMGSTALPTLPETASIRSLVSNSSGILFAATESDDGHVWRYSLGDSDWTSIAINQPTRSLLVVGDVLYGGLEDGSIVQYDGSSWSAVGTSPDNGAVIALAMGPTGTLYAGTQNGNVWGYSSGTWTNIGGSSSLSTMASGAAAKSVAVDYLGNLFAAAGSSVWEWAIDASMWVQVASAELDGSRVHTIAVNSAGDVYGGTQRGNVYKWIPDASSWAGPLGSPRLSIVDGGGVFSSGLDGNNNLYVATSSGNIYRFNSGTNTWVTIATLAIAIPSITLLNALCNLPAPFCGGDFPLNLQYTTAYGISWADVSISSANWATCFGPYALCYYAECTTTAGSNGTLSDCPCFKTFGTNFVDLNAILNEADYNENKAFCANDPDACQIPNQAPICASLMSGEFMAGQTTFSTFSFFRSRKEPIGVTDCSSQPGPYGGCMTAPCSGDTTPGVDGTTMINCQCPIYTGPYQIGKDNLTCNSTVYSAAYNPNPPPSSVCELIEGCVPDAPEDSCGCPLIPSTIPDPPPGTDCSAVCEEYDNCLRDDIQVGYTCDATICTSETTSYILDACNGLQDCSLSNIFTLEKAAGCSCCASQICGCTPSTETNHKVYTLVQEQEEAGETPQCQINGTLCGSSI